jgi:hypothetical protein
MWYTSHICLVLGASRLATFLQAGYVFTFLSITLFNVTAHLLMFMTCRELCPALLDPESGLQGKPFQRKMWRVLFMEDLVL